MKTFLQDLFVLMLCGSLFACSRSTTPDPVPDPVVPATTVFAKGADVSWVSEMEAAGKKFYNTPGAEQDLFTILKNLGMNTIRLRVWVNPANGYNNKADVVAKATRAKNAGMRVMIDFHYSDSWADPGKQTKPAAWAAQDINGLKTSLAAHTTDVLNALKTAGITPEWVQVGNETNDGLLWPEGRASTNMANYAALTAAGYDAVKAVFPSAKVIVHVSNGWDNNLFRYLFDGLKNNGGKMGCDWSFLVSDNSQLGHAKLASPHQHERHGKPVRKRSDGGGSGHALGPTIGKQCLPCRPTFKNKKRNRRQRAWCFVLGTRSVRPMAGIHAWCV